MQFKVLKSLLTWSADFSPFFGPKKCKFFVAIFQPKNGRKWPKMAENGQKWSKNRKSKFWNLNILILPKCRGQNSKSTYRNLFFRLDVKFQKKIDIQGTKKSNFDNLGFFVV